MSRSGSEAASERGCFCLCVSVCVSAQRDKRIGSASCIIKGEHGERFGLKVL